MRGPGFLIWKLRSLLPIDDTVAKIAAAGVKWVSIKVIDGTYLQNHINEKGEYTGTTDFLKTVIAKFKRAGISVGGWGFAYTSNAAAQGKLASSKVAELGLDHWLIDAEEYIPLGALWKHPGSDAAAKAYCDALSIPFGIPVALCSYRFPTFHAGFPFKTFLNHPKVNANAPQMYWLMASNPGDQLKRCMREYAAWSNKEFVPIGAAYSEFNWEPTPEQIKEFVEVSAEQGLVGYGFWVLDQAIKRPDWMEAATGKPTPPVPPIVVPPLPEPEPITKIAEVKTVLENGVRVRSAIISSAKYGPTPGVKYSPSSIWFILSKGDKVEVLETIKDGKNVWARIGQRQFIALKYDDLNLVK